jgi:hypothetical protein
VTHNMLILIPLVILCLAILFSLAWRSSPARARNELKRNNEEAGIGPPQIECLRCIPIQSPRGLK